MSSPQPLTDLLRQAGRLLLEYNESTAEIYRALNCTSQALTNENCHVTVSYGVISVTLTGENMAPELVSELRLNSAVQARVHEILAQVRRGQITPEEALTGLRRVEADTPRHSRWWVALLLGAAASSLACLLGADLGAAAVAGLATALGLLARQELARRHFSLLLLPFTASLIGAILGGLAIRLGWTQTPGLALVVPALMVVPGPHLINAVLDLLDNYLPMSLARLWLATGFLLASAAGIVIGVEWTLPDRNLADSTTQQDRLGLVSDMVLAGIATSGFAVFYNTGWLQLWMPILGGMTGHGFRFLALEAGCRLEAATFLGGLAVGVVSAWMAWSRNLPVAVIAFAGAVTMIPGISLYRALIGALQIARAAHSADQEMVAAALGSLLHGGLVVSGLTLGLIVGARAVLAAVRSPT